ncbi:MAG: DUF799 family lipoprotein, partial [Deltaproteobacteria bacterium]|nr:DUF799 family lipoprotein [Deltaproteobacteria bacterium]
MLLLAPLLLAACVPPATKDYARLLAAQPRSILIVPVVNKSLDLDAPDYFLSTLPVPVAERGYYVFPVNLVKRVLEDDGLADANLVHGADPTRLAGLFGADAVLYVSIERWDAKYLVLSTQVTVEFDYVLKSGTTGEELWRDHRTMVYEPQQTQNQDSPLVALLTAAVDAAVTKAAPNYMPLARRANREAFAWPGPGLPAGPYLPEHGKDLESIEAPTKPP